MLCIQGLLLSLKSYKYHEQPRQKCRTILHVYMSAIAHNLSTKSHTFKISRRICLLFGKRIPFLGTGTSKA